MINSIEHQVKFAVVGCGHIGKRHAEMVVQHPEAELVALADVRTPEETGAARYNVPHYTSLHAMLAAHPDIHVVCIATPNGLHASMAIACLEAGKHVVIEKPMALSKADAEAVIYKALQKSRLVFGVMQNRYSPPSVWLKDMIDSGRLGQIYLAQINCFWNRDARYYKPGNWHGTKDLDGGTLFTQFSHFIDIMYWLLGDIKNIHGKFYDFNHRETTEFEDSGLVTFDFVNGGAGTLQYSTSVWDQNLESSLTLIGEKGSVKVAGQYMNEVVYCHVENYVMPQLAPSNPPNDYGPYKGSAANHVYVIENAVDVLKGRSAITTNALEGLKVVEIIERIYQHKS
jgi:predicted dehydrogenase